MVENQLTEWFVVEYELDAGGNVGEDVEGEEEDQGDGGSLIGKTHGQSWFWLLRASKGQQDRSIPVQSSWKLVLLVLVPANQS